MSKLNVGIADDNELMVHLLSDIVARDEELQVVGTACNGEEAYKMIKTKEPDVVLLDIVMPKLDGLGVIDKVKKDKTLKKFPTFIMISAIGQERVTEDAFKLGADYYIMKPFDRDMIVNRIKIGPTSLKIESLFICVGLIREKIRSNCRKVWKVVSRISSTKSVYRHISKDINI